MPSLFTWGPWKLDPGHCPTAVDEPPLIRQWAVARFSSGRVSVCIWIQRLKGVL